MTWKIIKKGIRLKYYAYFTKRLGLQKYRRGWLKGDCPSCGKKNKFGVNIAQDRTNCFVCGYNDKPEDVICKIEKLDTFQELKAYLNDYDDFEIKLEKAEAFKLNEDATLPESYYNIRLGHGIFGKNARAYCKKRGFDINKISKKGWGYCTAGKYAGYIICPYYLDNKLVYFNARRYMLSGPRFNNPPIEDFGIGKSMLMYNRDALYLYNRVFILEGLMNAETIGDNAISFAGKSYSKWQLNEIIKSPVDKVVIALDREALEQSIRLALDLIQYKKVKLIIFEDDRDPNDLGRKKFIQIVSKTKYIQYNQLIKLKNEYGIK